MTETKAEELLPAALDAFTTSYPKRSLAEAELVYGPELTTSSYSLQYLLRGKYRASKTIRWWQANQMVASGTTPSGTPAGFGERYGRWEQEVRDSDEGYTEGPLQDIMEDSPLAIPKALREAAELATRIRGAQTLRDGNHRTSLMMFVLSLAEAHVILRPNFSLFRAYITLSARQHPENRDNVLFDSALTDTSAALFRYSRRRIKRGRADWAYLDHWSRAIRSLPVYVAHIEASYEYVRKLVDSETTEGSYEVQLERWRTLDEEEQRHVLLAHPDFKPGVYRKRWKWSR